MRNSPEIRLRSIAGQAGCEPDVALLWALIQIYRQSQVFGSARREQVEAALERIAHRVLVQRDWDDDKAELATAAK